MCRRHSGTALLDGEQYEASIGVMLLLLAGRCVGPRVGVALLQEGVLLAEAGVGGMGLGIGTYDDLTSRVTPSSTCERGETGGQTDRDRHTQQPIILSGKRRAHLGDSGEPQRMASGCGVLTSISRSMELTLPVAASRSSSDVPSGRLQRRARVPKLRKV